MSHNSHLVSLKRARAAKALELAGLMEAMDRLRAAEGEESAILAKIGELGAKEVDAVRAWAEAGAHGEMPRPEAETRARLHSQLIEAQARATAAKGASASLDADCGRVSLEMRDLAGQIEDEAVRQILRQVVEETNEAIRIADAARDKLASAFAARTYLVEAARTLFASGAEDRARAMFNELQRIAEMPRATLDPEPGQVQAATAKWDRHLDALVNDAPSPAEATTPAIAA